MNCMELTITFQEQDYDGDSFSRAIQAYNSAHPSAPISGAGDFAYAATKESLDDYLTRYRNTRLSMIADPITYCSDAQWNQITGILGTDA